MDERWMGDSAYVAPTVVREIRDYDAAASAAAPWDLLTLTVVLRTQKIGARVTLDLWSKKGKRKSKKIMDTFAFLLRLMLCVVRRTCPQALVKHPHVHIHVVPCDARKVLPSDGVSVVGVDHVNGGFAFSSADGQHHIVVYRMEDLFKVTLHELIHAYALDFRTYDAKWDRRLARMFGAWANTQSFQPKLFEAYTEAVACVLHICAFAILATKTKKNYAQLCASLWAQESAHYRSRCSVLSRYMRKAHGGRYREDSHVFSYYFVKASLFASETDFVDFLRREGVFVCFRRSAVHAFLKLVETCMERDSTPSTASTSASTSMPRSLAMTSIQTGQWLSVGTAPKSH